MAKDKGHKILKFLKILWNRRLGVIILGAMELFLRTREKSAMKKLKVDLVMWTKDNARMLPLILKRIDEVIPAEIVAKRILVDDHSSDNTAQVAESFGWTVYKNKGKGIKAAAATALSHVTADFFISIEHDILLPKNWWSKISPYLKDESVAIAQGARIATHPILRKLDEYAIERKEIVSMDNNVYRTATIRKLPLGGGDGIVAKRQIEEIGMKWIVDRTVVSDHVRNGILPAIMHDYKMQSLDRGKSTRLKMFRLFLTSPLRALHATLKTKCPQLLIVYPLDRLAILKGELERSARW